MSSIDPSESAMWQQTLLPAAWPAAPRVRAFTTLRGPAGVSLPPFDRCNLGLRSGDDPAQVARNRADLAAYLELPSPPRWLRQVHGTAVARFNDAASTIEPEADASITAAPGVVLAILTADCLPVLFCSVDGDEIGAAHAGWRGLVAGVLENTVAAMRTPPERLLAWLGPAAGPQAYEIGEEVRDVFVSRDPNAAAMFVATRPGHWLIDLYGLAR
ncbi:MAG: peptidoglycan editing factor PgeF, partial [Lysobacteraceae bacterium]